VARQISLVALKIILAEQQQRLREHSLAESQRGFNLYGPPGPVESFKVIQQQFRDATASVIHKTHVSRVEMASRAIFVTNEIYNTVCQPAQRVHVSQFKTTHKMQAFRNGQAKRGICKYVCEHQSSSM